VAEHDAFGAVVRPRTCVIAAADIGRNDLQNDTVIELALTDFQFRKIDRLDFDLTGAV